MAAPHLSAVPNPSAVAGAAGDVHDLGRTVETGAERIKRLQQEARILAREQVEALAHDLEALAQRAAEIAEGGDVYPPGIRDLAHRFAEEAPQKAQGLLTILHRTAQT
jgi:hypothetical protein